MQAHQVPGFDTIEVAKLKETSRNARELSTRLQRDLEKICSQVSSEVQRLQKSTFEMSSKSRSQPRLSEPVKVGPQVTSADAGLLASLTLRERQVLALIGEGKRNKEIAHLLGITIKTATTHRTHIMDKLSIHEGPVLVRFAIRSGLCPI